MSIDSRRDGVERFPTSPDARFYRRRLNVDLNFRNLLGQTVNERNESDDDDRL